MIIVEMLHHVIKGFILYGIVKNILLLNDKKKNIQNQFILCLTNFIFNILSMLWGGTYLNIIDLFVVLVILTSIIERATKRNILYSLSIAMISYLVYSSVLVAVSPAAYAVSYFTNTRDYVLLYTIVVYGIVIWLMNRRSYFKKWPINSILERKIAQIFIIVSGMTFLIISKGIVAVSEFMELNVVNVFLFIVMCLCSVMVLMWIIERVDHFKEKQAVLADNKKMDSKLHRQKELFPSIEFYLGDLIQELEGGKDPTDALRKVKVLRQELGQIYGEQRIESRRDVMIGQFTSTGLQLLDGQLNRYMLEAVKKNIDFDVMVSASIDESLKKYEIKHSDVHVLVGDLVRNAFRAVERKDDDSSKIFFCSGYIAPGDYEIDVYDDGAEFPLEVLKNFGIRGVTTGGTGNGLADVLETLAQYKASLRLEEFRPLSNEHTKGLSIVFDGMGEISIESYRYQLLESIGLPENVLLIAPVDEKL